MFSTGEHGLGKLNAVAALQSCGSLRETFQFEGLWAVNGVREVAEGSA